MRFSFCFFELKNIQAYQSRKLFKEFQKGFIAVNAYIAFESQ